MAFEGFDPIFSKPKVEWASQSSCPFFVHVYAPDSSHLVIHVTNICDAWEARLSLSMLEDIRDSVGIGGYWSEFADYFITSLKSQDLKLVLETDSNSDVYGIKLCEDCFGDLLKIMMSHVVKCCHGVNCKVVDYGVDNLRGKKPKSCGMYVVKLWLFVVLLMLQYVKWGCCLAILDYLLSCFSVSHAKLVAQKSKGMPLITIPLTKLADSTAMEVKLNFCSSLFDAFKIKSMECSLVKEREHSARSKMLAAEKERNEMIQLEQRQKFQKISDLENGVSSEGLQNSPDKQAARDAGSTKVKTRKVPAYRRQK
ncbi:unnamed protein product [Sphenostylis stenocarpa]|uniref:Uncharacterized protein n=1 Tax=Sphenostylis stenocarpa TaxID=92480 RepID=A0AA86SDQ5_9FABA|nr:unnamed protein product [Sphenostylis stenocarpa]